MHRPNIRPVEYTNEQGGAKDILLFHRPKESVPQRVEERIVEETVGRGGEREDVENNQKYI